MSSSRTKLLTNRMQYGNLFPKIKFATQGSRILNGRQAGLPYARPLDQTRRRRSGIQRGLGANKELDGADRAILRVWFLAGDDWLYGAGQLRSKYSSGALSSYRSCTKCVFKGAVHLLLLFRYKSCFFTLLYLIFFTCYFFLGTKYTFYFHCT